MPIANTCTPPINQIDNKIEDQPGIDFPKKYDMSTYSAAISERMTHTIPSNVINRLLGLRSLQNQMH